MTNEAAKGLDTGYSAERFKTFADAVVAIAITLLILPLMESVSDVAAEGDTTAHWFAEHSSQITSFLISFVLIALFWTIHHRVFARVERITPGLMWITMGWLLSIVWFPVATALSGQMPVEDPLVRIVYIGSMIATTLLMLAQRLYLRAHPQLHGAAPETLLRGACADIAMAILFAAALALSLLFPPLSYFPLFLLWFTGLLQRALYRLVGDRST